MIQKENPQKWIKLWIVSWEIWKLGRTRWKWEHNLNLNKSPAANKHLLSDFCLLLSPVSYFSFFLPPPSNLFLEKRTAALQKRWVITCTICIHLLSWWWWWDSEFKSCNNYCSEKCGRAVFSPRRMLMRWLLCPYVAFLILHSVTCKVAVWKTSNSITACIRAAFWSAAHYVSLVSVQQSGAVPSYPGVVTPGKDDVSGISSLRGWTWP